MTTTIYILTRLFMMMVCLMFDITNVEVDGDDSKKVGAYYWQLDEISEV